jgi:hypothetical protein
MDVPLSLLKAAANPATVGGRASETLVTRFAAAVVARG